MTTYPRQVTDDDGESHGERDGAAVSGPVLVEHRVDGEDEDEGDDELNADRLAGAHVLVHAVHPVKPPLVGGGEGVDDGGAPNRPRRLAEDVEQGAGGADLTTDPHRQRHRRVDVRAGDGRDAGQDGGDGEAGGQRQLDDRRPRLVPTHRRARREEDEEAGTERLGGNGSPEERTLHVVHALLHREPATRHEGGHAGGGHSCDRGDSPSCASDGPLIDRRECSDRFINQRRVFDAAVACAATERDGSDN